jgi:hypothetical protein
VRDVSEKPAVESQPPAVARQLHYGQVVWEGEHDGYYWMAGHVAPRRAIAAANRYARIECGLENAADDPDASLESVTVSHLWFREDIPNDTWVLCRPTQPRAQPFTAVAV